MLRVPCASQGECHITQAWVVSKPGLQFWGVGGEGLPLTVPPFSPNKGHSVHSEEVTSGWVVGGWVLIKAEPSAWYAATEPQMHKDLRAESGLVTGRLLMDTLCLQSSLISWVNSSLPEFLCWGKRTGRKDREQKPLRRISRVPHRPLALVIRALLRHALEPHYHAVPRGCQPSQARPLTRNRSGIL